MSHALVQFQAFTIIALAAPACGAVSSVVEGEVGRAMMGSARSEPAPSPAATPAAAPATPVGGGHAGGAMPPQMATMYTQMMFQYAFGMGGFYVEDAPFAPGDWVRWSLPKAEAGETAGNFERARLTDDADGNQWWRVKWTTTDSQVMTSEALLKKDLTQILRMRSKMPGDTDAKEQLVSEQTWFVPPQRPTPQSLHGATVGTGPVTVPAGTFTARHIVFAGGGGGSADWWLASGVPGGVVKQAFVSQRDNKQAAMELVAYGKGAVSELGSR